MPIDFNQNNILSEHNVSNMMTDFYGAVILAHADPWDVSYNQYGGNSETKEKMQKFCEYLELVKLIAKDEDIYKEQFLTPVNLTAQFLKDIRNRKSQRSIDMKGWIFSTSKPTQISQYDISKKVTVSAVFPQLQTIMSISVPEDSTDKKILQYNEFKNCQPIPLVNRIHQTKSIIKIQQNKTVQLSEFNFLFTSFGDII